MIEKKTPQEHIVKLAPSCSCSKCNHGCTIGSGFLAAGEEKKLAEFLSISEEELKEKYLEEVNMFEKTMLRPKIQRDGKPFGKCIFYNGSCKVHEAKPLQCKVSMGCKNYGEDLMIWFMLNHIIDTENPEAIRQYDKYLKSGGKTIKGGKLQDLFPEKETREKILNFEILK